MLAASLNWLPHSGITAPLISRGGQSTLALAGAVILALVLAYHDHRPQVPATAEAETVVPPAPGARGPAAVPLIGLVALVLATLLPYDGYPLNRPICPVGPTAPAVVDPALCSTDTLVLRRTTVEVGLPDGTRYARSLADGWHRVAGPGPDDVAALGGILTADGIPGLADEALGPVLRRPVPVTTSDRLVPHLRPGGPDGGAELTLDPVLQTAALAALTADRAGAPPLAGGLVLLDAQTGHVLAAVSAPRRVPATAGAPVVLSEEERAAFEVAQGGPGYGVLQADGSIRRDDAVPCGHGASIDDFDERCVRWRLQDTALDDRKAAQAAEDERYVGGGAGAPLPADLVRPESDVNRALGKGYGFGSTFKVVVAAAWLRAHPDEGPDSVIAAPRRIVFPDGRVLDNFDGDGTADGAPCPGEVGGTIPLRTAAAVSCNTAFVGLAQEVGWSRVRDMAVDLGFARGDATAADRPHGGLAGSDLALSSVVPDEAPGSAIGNVALGGGDIDGTPLQMAAVMATIANGGHAVQPALASDIEVPGQGVEQRVPVRTGDPMTPEVAAKLTTALADTVTECRGCTLKGLARPRTAGGALLEVHAKTGTQVLRPDPDQDRDQFVRENSWIAGFTKVGGRPVAFALVLEAGAAKGSGGARARAVLADVLQAMVKERE